MLYLTSNLQPVRALETHKQAGGRGPAQSLPGSDMKRVVVDISSVIPVSDVPTNGGIVQTVFIDLSILK